MDSMSDKIVESHATTTTQKRPNFTLVPVMENLYAPDSTRVIRPPTIKRGGSKRRRALHVPFIVPEEKDDSSTVRARLNHKLPLALRPGKRPRPTTSLEFDGQRILDGLAGKEKDTPREVRGQDCGPNMLAQGKRLMAPSACVSGHPFAETLSKWETGVPVDCGEQWEWTTVEAAVAQGPHKSATSAESIALVATGVDYQVKAGYAEIISWRELQRLRPRNLKISPLAVIPQRNRRGRMILDLSFAVRRQAKGRRRGRKRGSKDMEPPLAASVNDTTVRQAPEAPVKELGNVLLRVLDFMATVPEEEDIHFAKVDLADGYWRMIVEKEQRYNFAYVLPTKPGMETMIVVPSALQMGWNESPAYFCATTETVRDVSQAWIDDQAKLPWHPMEKFTTPTTPACRQSSEGPQWQMSAVYVDDHIMCAVEDRQGKLLRRTARATLHAIHSVFQTPAATGTPEAKDPISQKKLDKGDGRFATEKEILGYLLDGTSRTIRLPTDRADALLKEVKAILRKSRVQLKRFRSILGRLQHAARILPAARAFFTPLNAALRGSPAFIGLSRTGEVRYALLDVAAVIRDLAGRPTHVSELVQGDLHHTGYCDASAFGAGGVWLGATVPTPPIVWRVQWPADISADVVSDTNPGGRLTNSDLEMAGVLLQEAVLEEHLGPAAMRAIQTAIGCDNSPAVAWTTRMASRSASPISFRLLKGLAMRQRVTRSAPPPQYSMSPGYKMYSPMWLHVLSKDLHYRIT